MWVKLIIPSGAVVPGGYERLEAIVNLSASGSIGGSYYVQGRIGNDSVFDNENTVYLDPAYSTLADAQAAVDRLVDDQGLLT